MLRIGKNYHSEKTGENYASPSCSWFFTPNKWDHLLPPKKGKKNFLGQMLSPHLNASLGILIGYNLMSLHRT